MKTAKEFISNVGVTTSPVSGLKSYLKEDVKQTMIEFAKLHVQAALEAATNLTNKSGIPRIVDNKDSILNSYPLDNIK